MIKRFLQATSLCLLTQAGMVMADNHERFKDVKIASAQVSEGLYMLTGAGGNMAVSIGKNGTYLVDDQFAPLSERILTAIKDLGGDVPKFLLNTHWHGDHTGGNENFGKQGSIIVAHDNVRERMSSNQFIKAFNRKVEPAPEAALPVITFGEGVNFHWNGDVLRVRHQPNAHTDTDSFVQFKAANVIHTGDLYFAGMYPFIDASSGGSITGVIAAADQILEVADVNTKIIPGHGKLSNKAELAEYRDMLKLVESRISKMIAEGKTRLQIVEAKPTADLDEKWGGGFMKPDKWVSIVYDGLN
ncbi:MBL fold metallo-hydrolase [Aliamphritea hakodatensis]|uniref:MBL fold metallo-hydrolase n=1 Tax=Aliamphritea hakodatensis TaxID=2895352 RepID=UPI0022FD4E4A|nr:MBL fold metallo-hydrolase [Aliamphritea hakodatensis]